ncbi:KPN_02809 family neutral zinc metallopeptidase [Protaetiibacter intestinalis]|uniref:Neutral zinc metallopeptidase n=1 Tax=Protaetiibacter intestinalis TaxID=2419774 RepID=A0A387B7G2_9MICO|nr:neutral zinc metallopeptidase [Protaetiibacter intestinalis]AYF97688.1 neutral zinc metallopeptidase [Protaetiibacter intestinalis]
MTFNDDADISKGRVSRRAKTGIALGGGGGLIGIVVLIVALAGGPDLTGLVEGVGGGGSGGEDTAVGCTSGEEANESVDCRMQGAYASLDDYWASQVEGYRSPADFVLFTGSVNTGCGSASSAVGPFYCPPDETIYLDTGFFDELTSLGGSSAPLAQLYVVAHEWGHHIQNIVGQMDGLDTSATGPDSDGVRLELQADCYAGAWVGAAEDTVDDQGNRYLDPITDDQLAEALATAQAIGDDRIQETTQGQVNPETWTHGSSEQRQRWFEVGRTKGPQACDTFSIPGSRL